MKKYQDTKLYNEQIEKLDRGSRAAFSGFRIGLVVILILFVYLSTMIITNLFTIRKYTQERQKIQTQLEKAEVEIKELEEYIAHARDPEFVEKMARENLKMVMPNEKVYIVMN